MFKINDDLSIHVTRGDIILFAVAAKNDDETVYTFQPGDLLRIKVFVKKNCENVVLQKDFPVTSETEEVAIYLDENDTKIGDTISKTTDYWYEIELNPLSDPQTIIGYDENGAKIFRLYPEGADIDDYEVPSLDDIPIIDDELDLSSQRPIQNQAVARALTRIEREVKLLKEQIANLTTEDAVT